MTKEQFIDKWIEARDVTIDYADTLDDVAKAFAKLAVKKLLFEELFNDDKQKELLEYVKSGDYAGLTGEVANLMNSVQNLGPQVAQILQAFDPYFDRSDQTSGSVGQGIKGITEDTADLLASYINAMRADVSYMRSMQEAGLPPLPSTNTLRSAPPTLSTSHNPTPRFSPNFNRSSGTRAKVAA